MSPDVQLIARTPLFQGLPRNLLARLLEWSSVRSFSAGDLVVREGDPGMELYVVLDGEVEVQAASRAGGPPTTMALLGQGECFGEMAMITGHARSATLYVPEHADLLEISEDFVRVLLYDAHFLQRLCRMLAFRLELANANLARPAAAAEQPAAPRPTAPAEEEGGLLQGDLRFFDLTTVVQTLIGSGLGGVLELELGDGRRAEVGFAGGRIPGVRLGGLQGEEAFFQLFQEGGEGRFAVRAAVLGEGALGQPVTRNAMSLLLEACRMKDELPALLRRVGGPARVLVPAAPTPGDWPDPATAAAARAAWERVLAGDDVAQLLAALPCCAYHGLAVLEQLLGLGLVR